MFKKKTLLTIQNLENKLTLFFKSGQLLHQSSVSSCLHPDEPFRNFGVQNPSRDVPELHEIRRSPALVALNMWQGSLGSHYKTLTLILPCFPVIGLTFLSLWLICFYTTALSCLFFSVHVRKTSDTYLRGLISVDIAKWSCFHLPFLLFKLSFFSGVLFEENVPFIKEYRANYFHRA